MGLEDEYESLSFGPKCMENPLKTHMTSENPQWLLNRNMFIQDCHVRFQGVNVGKTWPIHGACGERMEEDE